MTTARDMRRCALQALYQFDAGNESVELVRESLEHTAASEGDREAGFDLACAAWALREEADAATGRLTPEWPTYRQPVVDRSILRLAYCELVSGRTPPKVAINEAVELAREFSTERSPQFVNGVLDKVWRSLRGAAEPADEAPETAGEAPEPAGGSAATDAPPAGM